MALYDDKNLSRSEVEKIARQAAQDVYAQQGTQFGVSTTPMHIHNNVDSPKIPASSVIPSLAASGRITFAQDAHRYSIGLNTKAGTNFSPTQIRFNGIAIYEETTFTVSAANVTFNDIYISEGILFFCLGTIIGGTTLVMAGYGAGLSSLSGTLTKVSGSGDPTVTYSSFTVTNKVRVLIQGDAFVGPSYYLQPFSTTEVTIGGPPQVAVQSSSCLIINATGSGLPTLAEAHEGHVADVEFPAGNVVARATIPDNGDFDPPAFQVSGPIQDGALLVDIELSPGWAIIGNFLIM